MGKIQVIPAVVVFIRKLIGGKPHFLTGIREGRFLALPGGKMESTDDSLFETATREVREETGLVINPCYLTPHNIPSFRTEVFHRQKASYVVHWVYADWICGDPKELQPHDMVGWQWRTFEEVEQFSANFQGNETEREEQQHFTPIPELRRLRTLLGI